MGKTKGKPYLYPGIKLLIDNLAIGEKVLVRCDIDVHVILHNYARWRGWRLNIIRLGRYVTIKKVSYADEILE